MYMYIIIFISLSPVVSRLVLSDVRGKMGQRLCICSRGSLTIDNKRYYFIQKLDEG